MFLAHGFDKECDAVEFRRLVRVINFFIPFRLLMSTAVLVVVFILLFVAVV